MDTNTLAGEYYLQGVMEMASGFLLEADGAFKFFFTYGALDRYGSGKWMRGNNQVIFNSTAKPGNDFAMIDSKRVTGDKIIIRVKDNNQTLVRYVYGSLKKGTKDSWVPANKDGEIIFPKQEIESISLLFEFCPERFSTFSIHDKTCNEFIFRFEPWIMEVFLNDFVLHVDGNELFGRHPILEGKQFRYARQ
jgi:hypothetical protein